MMDDDLVILTAREQEYLMRAIESALHVREKRQFFLWVQGQFQALLPHDIMVCIQYDDNNDVLHIECLHGLSKDAELIENLVSNRGGIAVQIANLCRTKDRLPCLFEVASEADTGLAPASLGLLAQKNVRNAIVHGTGRLLGGSSFFLMFSMSESPNQRHMFFLELLLPHLHMAWQRIVSRVGSASAINQPRLLKSVTDREIEILRWVKEGKSNYEIGVILGISPLTVKNHLQKIYKKLNVQTRVQAVSSCMSMHLLSRANDR